LRTRQKGLSLIELMVGITVGLVVVMAALTLYGSGTQAARVNRELARMAADASLVTDYLADQLRMAGYSQVGIAGGGEGVQVRRFEGRALTACDGGFSDPSHPGEPACASDATQPDGLLLRYEVDGFNAAQGAGGVPLDCRGQPITAQPVPAHMQHSAAAAEFYLAEHRIYLAGPAAGPRQLVCRGNGGTPFASALVIAPNIEDFQLAFTAVDAASGTATKSASPSVLATAFTDADTAWRSARAAHICLVVVSEPNLAEQPVPYRRCDGTVATPSDRRLRRTFEATVSLRNQIPSGL
jgi:type IV pilus assembly protein PilW